MIYTVEETAIKLNVSKQAIYNKLKLNEYKDKVLIKQGQKYVDDDLFNLIKDNLKFKNNLNSDNIIHPTIEDEKAQDSISNDDLFKLNKELIDTLHEQLKIKDMQIQNLNDRLATEQELTKNRQILELKQQPDIKQLEEHFKNLDNKLIEVREQMQQRKNKKSIFNIFKNKKE
jgi:hypothetical protein